MQERQETLRKQPVSMQRQTEIQLESSPLRIEKKPPFIHVYPDSSKSYAELKPALYRALNTFSREGFVLIHDVPACVLPDATENLANEKLCGSAKRIRVPACASCPLSKQCTGVPEHFAQSSQNILPWKNELRELAIEVTRGCQFSCPFCFYKNFYENNSKHNPPKEFVKQLIDKAKSMGATSIRFFGGDPILRPDFLELLQHAKQQGMYCIVNTNGLFKSREYMHAILEAADLIIISLHGYDTASEQELTGRGDLLPKILLNIKRLTSLAPEKIMASTLVTTHLLENFQTYANLMHKLGLQRWGLNRPLFAREEYEKHSWLHFSKEQVVKLASQCLALKTSAEKEREKIDVKLTNYPWCMFPTQCWEVLQPNHSYNGITRLFYDTEGYFKPAPSMNINLGTDLEQAWQHNQFRLDTREFLPTACTMCGFVEQCMGGSRSQAHTFTNEWNAQDPLMNGAVKE